MARKEPGYSILLDTMTKLKKKGREGTASEYITRNHALKKLQLSLRDFRRLCILKGIYPRDPAHKNRIVGTGTNKTSIYLLKDIKFLSHEPLLSKFRALKAFYRRLCKYAGKGETAKVRSLEKNAKPDIRLDHLVRERYPSFVDALRDLDDPLSMLALFATLPRTSNGHQADTSRKCGRLLREFEAYVIATGSLKKVFISIKGIYYRAIIMGQTVTWVVPHEFTTPVPTDVDYEVMLTFLEFYLVLMKFVNFRLFNRLGWEYPQKFIPEGTEVILRESFPEISHPEEILPEGDRRLLSDAKVFVSREVPKKSLTLILQCLGATVSFESIGDGACSITEDDPSITHQIVDRPTLNRMFVDRLYVQPQWVFDSLNAATLVDVTNYRIGAALPPHLSPFVSAEEDEDEDGEESEEMEEIDMVNGTEQAEGQPIGKSPEKNKKNKKGKTAQKELAVSMMSKKRQKLYKMMQYTRNTQAKEKKKLAAKRQKAAAESKA